MRLRTIALIVALAGQFFVAPVSWTQDAPATAADVDSLFDSPPESDTTDSGATGAAASDGTVLDDLLQAPPFEIGAKFRMNLGYSAGSLGLPWAQDAAFQGLPVLELSGTLSVRYSISPAFTVRQQVKVAYPGYAIDVTEFALDHTILDTLFFSAGLQKVSWGRSPNYPFADLPNRDKTSGTPLTDRGDLLVRATLPIGVGGLELLAQSRDDYSTSTELPAATDIGYGVRIDVAQEGLDLDLGVFYKLDRPTRLAISANTTVADWLEMYGEAMVALEWTSVGLPESDYPTVELIPGTEKIDNPVDAAASIGAVVGLFHGALDLNIEYYFNGEESWETVAGARFPLFYGHNLAANVRADLGGPFHLQAKAEHNFYLQSGIVAPVLTVHLLDSLDLSAGIVAVYGPDDAGYVTANPDPLDRNVYAALSLVWSGRI